MINYIEQEKDLFKTFEQLDLFPLPKGGEDYHINEQEIELIIRPNCTQQCEYCYIYKYGKDLYPEVPSRQEILNNVKLFLDYIYNQRKNFLYGIELFAGDLFYDNIYFDIIDILESFLKPIKKDYPELFDREILIMMPNNLNWVYYNPEKVEKFREYFYRFRKEYNTILSASWSTDGYYAMNTREKKILPESYFDTIFSFCKEFECGYHPMIAAENIHTWIQNYDWWIKKYEQFNLTDAGDFQPFMLMVRNNNWTDENINDYCKLLYHMMQYRLKLCNNSVEELTYHLLNGDGENNTLHASHGFDPLIFNDSSNQDGLCCSVQHMICLNCTNLSLSCCHRTSYPQFTGVYFLTNEDKTKIIDFKPQNVNMYITTRLAKTTTFPLCANCNYSSICIKGCYGAQYEDSGEIFLPIKSLCNFFKKTNDYLYELYNQFGIIECGLKNNYINYDRHSFLYNKFQENKKYGN